MLLFEFDEQKSWCNLEKHGIDFIAAQELWSDPRLIEVPARTADEPRFLVVGCIEGKHWSAVIPIRAEASESFRFAGPRIPVRRSRTEEVALYESEGI